MTSYEYECILSAMDNVPLFDTNIANIIESYIYQKCKNECKKDDGTEYIEEYVSRYEEKVGNYKAYYKESGNILQTGFYIDNKMEGKWITYYENGNYEEISNLKNDLETGLGLAFTVDGRIYFKGYYKDDKANGLAKLWYYNDLKYHETYFVNDIVEEQYIYELIPYSNKRRRYKKGRLLIHDIYGKNQSRISYEGDTKTVYPYIDGMINGVAKKYEILSPTTHIFLREAFYENNNCNGFVREYFPYGGLKKKYELKNGVGEGKYTEWNIDGDVICEGMCKNGCKEGLFKMIFKDCCLLVVYKENEILEKRKISLNIIIIFLFVLFYRIKLFVSLKL